MDSTGKSEEKSSEGLDVYDVEPVFEFTIHNSEIQRRGDFALITRDVAPGVVPGSWVKVSDRALFSELNVGIVDNIAVVDKKFQYTINMKPGREGSPVAAW